MCLFKEDMEGKQCCQIERKKSVACKKKKKSPPKVFKIIFHHINIDRKYSDVQQHVIANKGIFWTIKG